MPTPSISFLVPLAVPSLRRLSRLPAALLLAASTLGGSVLAANHNVPLKVTVQTQEVLRLDPQRCPAFPFLAGTTTGTGTASHLGAVTLLAGDCITPGAATYTFDDGRLTLTAANGDQLTAIYRGTLQPPADGSARSPFTISGTVTITGGTGRFAGASGSGYLGGSENLLTGQGQFEVTATLSY